MNENGKMPIGIVNTVIHKISDFTKELEILRHQLPEKDDLNSKIDKMNNKFDKAMLVVKVVTILMGSVVVLSLFGAKLLNYWEEKQPKQNIQIEERIEDMQKNFDDKFNKILEQMKQLHKEKPEESIDEAPEVGTN